MKKILTLVGVFAGAFTLTGCDLNNQEMENIISKCKADTECKAILDREIDEALEERGIFGYSEEDMDYDIFYDLELTDEEQALLETLEALDNELWEKFEGMTDEEFEALEFKEFENMLGRELTEEELAAIELVEKLWDFEVEYETYETEQEYLEFYLGRELTQDEIDALSLIEAVFTEENEDEEVTLTTEQEAAFDLIEELYNQVDEVSEIQELELVLGRQLTQEELDAFTVVESIEYHDYDEEITLTPEQEAAWDLIDALYEEAYNKSEQQELEFYLNRELTQEEIDAIDVVNNLYEEMYDNYDVDYTDEDYIQETINYYQTILERNLTQEEIDAIEFSLEFYFYEDMLYDDDMFHDEYDYDFDEYDYDFDDFDYDEDFETEEDND